MRIRERIDNYIKREVYNNDHKPENRGDKLIFNTFSFIHGYQSGALIPEKDELKRKEAYLKNSILSLISARLSNPDSDVALCTNIETPQWYSEMAKAKGIKIIKVPFDKFSFDKDTRWSLTFYKLCVLEYLLCNTSYSYFCMLDVDTLVVNSMKSMWKESEYGVLMYENFRPYYHDMKTQIRDEFKRVYPEVNVGNAAYWNGGEVAADRLHMELLMEQCTLIYKRLVEKKFQTQFGDEFFWFVVDKLKQGLIFSGNAYFEHFWTENGYYVVSTEYIYEKKPVLHFPNEKTKGLLKLFDYYNKKGRLPEMSIFQHMLNIPGIDKRPYWICALSDNLEGYIKRLVVKGYYSNRKSTS